MAVDRAVVAAVLNPLMIIVGAQQAVNVNARNPLQCEHDCMRTDKAFDPQLVLKQTYLLADSGLRCKQALRRGRHVEIVVRHLPNVP